MSTFDLLCHCGGDADGHVPARARSGCEPLASRRIRPFRDGPALGTPGASAAENSYSEMPPLRPYKAIGTCPGCRTRRPVERIGIFAVHAGGGRSLLAREPRIAEHRSKGQTKPCAGGIPTEVTFRPGAEVARWVDVYGEDSIVRSPR